MFSRKHEVVQLHSYATPSTIRQSVIGSQHSVMGPFGAKPLIYADSTASGKSLSFVEDYLRDVVLPFYANTHTEASATGLQTTHFREQARDCVRQAVHAPKEEYAVVFTGSGSTGAVDKLARVLGLSPLIPKINNPNERPVVFIGPYEHHSNELPWREAQCDVVAIPEDKEHAGIDTHCLVEELRAYKDRPLKIGSFSAASNVTGIRCDTRKVTKILHDHGCLACWDFAAAGPHVEIDMESHEMEALYLSPHKFIGGPETPGILVARRRMFRNKVPTVPGGGTVVYVQPHGHKYLDDIEPREEGGTPAIVGSIRAGLVLQLHAKMGPGDIERTENRYLQRAFNVWSKSPKLEILGHPKAKERVSIVSFRVKAPGGSLYLHYNFVVAILNDLFGIQSRGGCSCAGPYGHFLFNIDHDLSDTIVHEMARSGDAIKPGWTRISFSYYMSKEMVNYMIQAVDMVAREGYKLLPWYHFHAATAMWTHVDGPKMQPMELWDFGSSYSDPPKLRKKDLTGMLKQASKTLSSLDVKSVHAVETPLPDRVHELRWFLLPEEVRYPLRRPPWQAYLQSSLSEEQIEPSSPTQSHRRFSFLRRFPIIHTTIH